MPLINVKLIEGVFNDAQKKKMVTDITDDIPLWGTVMDRLECRGKIEFVRSVYPGTTVTFRVTETWARGEIPIEGMTSEWTSDEIENTWERWGSRFENDTQRARLMCGACLFLHDVGHTRLAMRRFSELVRCHGEEIRSKWCYLRDTTRLQFEVRADAPRTQAVTQADAGGPPG
jgi:hypothetical protein